MKITPPDLTLVSHTHPEGAERPRPGHLVEITSVHLQRDTEAARRAVGARARSWGALDQYTPHEVLACPPVRQVVTCYAAMDQRQRSQAQRAGRVLLDELVSVLADRRGALARAALELRSEPGQEIALVQAALLERASGVDQALEAAQELASAPDPWEVVRTLAWLSQETAQQYAQDRGTAKAGEAAP